MFIDFSINRELTFRFDSFYSPVALKSELPFLPKFDFIKFSKPKLFEASANFFPFLVLSNGSLVFVEFSFNKFERGALLFDDLYC